MIKTYKLYTDGSHFTLDKLAGIGGYIEDADGNTIAQFSELINDAHLYAKHEMVAMKKGLELCLENGITHLECYSDDKTATQIYNIKDEETKKIYFHTSLSKEILKLINSFESISFTYLPREFNKKADKLSRQEILKYKSSHHYKNDITGSLKLDVLESINTYPSKDNFIATNKLFEHFIVVDCDHENKSLTTYYAFKDLHNAKNNKITSQILDQKIWTEKNLKEVMKSLILGLEFIQNNESIVDKKCVISCYGDPSSHISNVMRGRIAISRGIKNLVDQFIEVSDNFEQIRYHLDSEVINATVPSSQVLEKEPLAENELLNAMRILGETDYYIGKNPNVENLIPMKNIKKTNVAEMQKMYFSVFLRMHIEDITKQDVKLHPQQKKQMLEKRIEQVRDNLHKQGIKLRI